MSSDVHLFGIKNCDTVRKAIRWLAEKQISSVFHDLKKEPLEAELITEWLAQVGKDKLINKRGLTWRKIPAEDKILDNQQEIIQLIQDNPTVIKRPIIFNGMFWSVGFNSEEWNELFL